MISWGKLFPESDSEFWAGIRGHVIVEPLFLKEICELYLNCLKY